MMRAALIALALSAVPVAAKECRQALALGLDVSGSVDDTEYRLQLDGLALALEHTDVRAALFAMPSASVALTVYEWAGRDSERIIVPWTAIDGPETLERITGTLRGTARRPTRLSTALMDAQRFGAGLLAERSGCWKRTLDISGDGKGNDGPAPYLVDRDAFLTGITVNGLVIGADNPSPGDERQQQIAELRAYFEAYVLYGPDAFAESALGYQDFYEAMVRKLKRELEGLAMSRLSGADQ